ncbi:efflux RND transporter periplasmic adaptor subunit [uncultured Porphyromonas sp.]|uniref:efflux RND transporter periplasmic adaptor subunit n=1 Tax=uncultured Porphyromonas sp. TaxID=159274 RepID=UPI0026126E58|nr:efflux RND transporter periplasmic adaptor subunit [uncultured Porphyromonas sp.]
MKRKVYIPILIVVIIGGIVFTLISNKRSTAAKTEGILLDQTAVAVRTEVVSERPYSMDFSANGLVRGIHDQTLTSAMGGRVVALRTKEGDRVSRGQLLVQIDAETLGADAEAAKVAYEAAQRDYQRFKNAHEQGGVTDQQLAAIHTQMVAAEGRYTAARRRLSDASVVAPTSGEIYKSYVEVGSFVNPGAKLFEIVDDSQLKVSCYVTERQRLQLSKNQNVRIMSELFPSQEITGHISMIGDKANQALSFPVDVMLDKETSQGLRPGMYVSLSFGGHTENTGILIPRNAIIGSINDAQVYIVRNGMAIRKTVTTGNIVGDHIEVVDGLQKGDSLVIAGLINISDGVPVKSIKE